MMCGPGLFPFNLAEVLVTILNHPRDLAMALLTPFLSHTFYLAPRCSSAEDAMVRSRLLLILAVIVFAPGSLHAWSNGGHMVIAAGAYRQLSPATRKAVDELLKAHPEYERWKESYAGEDAGMDLGMFVFMQASKWPDEIRKQHGEYDHPKWHYVNYPLKPPKFPAEPGPTPDDDILFGLRRSEEVLAGSGASAQSRAISLSWLIHLVGDLHQPLHCSTLITLAYPDGDKGGNEFYVAPARRGIKLHRFWDELLGTRNRARSQMNYADKLIAAHPRKKLKELKKHRKLEEWSSEGRELAIKKVYRRGKLRGSTTAEGAPGLPSGYEPAAKTVAEKQGALAVYRLADEIARVIE